MLKQVALVLGGIWLYKKIQNNQAASGEVVPTVDYDSVDSMSGIDLQITLDKLVERASGILDPVKRSEIINSISAWVDAGFSELQINQLIDDAVSYVDAMYTNVASGMPVQSDPIETIPDVIEATQEIEAVEALPVVISTLPFVEEDRADSPWSFITARSSSQAQESYQGLPTILKRWGLL